MSQVRPFQAEVSRVLHLVVNSLYSNKEIFLRELVSNASDALDKRRFAGLSEPALLPSAELGVKIVGNAENGTLTIEDNGIGMDQEALIQNLGTIAHSGTKQFIEQLEKGKGDAPQLIGQFGVGFYSAFLVADKVVVTSRAAGSEKAYAWTSDGVEGYELEEASRAEAGTTIVLHLKEDQKEYLDEYRLRSLVGRYSDFVSYPIELGVTKEPEEGSEDKAETSFEKINQGSAIWRRQPSELDEAQYEELYRHVSRDYQKPLAYQHFRIEGTQEFFGVVFLPRRSPMDMFQSDGKHGVRLHVRRVFVMDDCEELLPRHLRFIKGVVDSEDLPLNVSRETLQDSRQIRVIRKQIVSQSLSMISKLKEEKPEDYAVFWEQFGAVLKEGLTMSSDDRDKIAPLVMYPSTSEVSTDLSSYVARMPEDQKAIYYAFGSTVESLAQSPHLEALKKRGFEVLLMTDPVDPFAAEGLKEFEGKELLSAMDADLKLDGDKEETETPDVPWLSKVQEALGEQVSKVIASKRLTDSPACLVIPPGGLQPHIELMMRAQNMDVPSKRRIMELNLEHPVIQKISAIENAEEVKEWSELLFEQALIAEGSPLKDPGAFSSRVTKLMSKVLA